MIDTDLINYLQKTRNIQDTTTRAYKIYLNEYTSYYNMTLQQLLDEAENEEENGIRWKHRTLKKRLTEYRVYLYDKHSQKTARERFNKIQAFYRHFDIEIHNLPNFNEKNVNRPEPIRPEDLPDKEVLRSAIEIASPVMKAIILFMSSSGSARAETLSLTIKDYIKATKNYHNNNNIYKIIETLNQTSDVVPTWQIKRVKTDKYYTTFSSPESVTAINHYLQDRTDNITLESKLFKINPTTFTLSFEEINDKLNLGKIGHYRRFRSYMLRKYHASTLAGDGMSRDLINDLQGKSKTITDESYFMLRTEDLLNEYVNHLPSLLLNKDVEKITVKSQEFLKLENDNRELQETIKEQQNKYDTILQRIEALENKSDDDILAKFRKN